MNYIDVKTPEQLLKYMSNNLVYGYVDEFGNKYTDFKDWFNKCRVQTGEEVLNSNIGTCWDQVELERMWFENHRYEIKTIFIWFEKESDIDYPTHTFLLFKKDNKLYWFENAWYDYRGIHEFNTIENAIETIIDNHLKNVINKGIATSSDKKYIKVYEYNKLEQELSVEEYIDHATLNKKGVVK